MSANNVSSLPAGLQQLYDQGFFTQSLSTTTLKNASTSQLNQLANSSIANQESATLLGLNSDSSYLSSTATNYLAANKSSTIDPLTAALNEAILAPGYAAASKYLQQTDSTTGTQVNVFG